MEKDLSFILLLVGIIILLILFIFSWRTRIRPDSSVRNQRENKEKKEVMQWLEEQDMSLQVETINTGTNSVDVKEENISASPSIKNNLQSKQNNTIVLLIIPREKRKFRGKDVLQVLNFNKFHYGRMKIFHYHESIDGKGEVLFSVAQATEPGTFDLEFFAEKTCRGLALFMQLNSEKHNLKTYEFFIQTAQRLADSLRGVLADQNQQNLTAESIKNYKSIIKDHLQSLTAIAK